MSYLAENYAWVRCWYTTAITFGASLPMFLFGLCVGGGFLKISRPAEEGCGGFPPRVSTAGLSPTLAEIF